MTTMIAPASSSRVRISQVVEATRGTTPASPAWRVVPQLDSGGLEGMKTYERSNEVRSNRMGGRQIGGNKAAGGSIAVPLKNDPSVRDLVQSAFSCAFTNPTFTGAVGAFATNGTAPKLTFLFSAKPEDGDVLVLNGITFTFKTTPLGVYDVQIGATLAATGANLATKLNATLDDEITAARYTFTTATLTATYKTFGTAGNAYTVAWTFATITGTPNGGSAATSGSATMTGGTGTGDTITHSGNLLKSLGFRAGAKLTIASSTTAGNDGTYYVTAVAADGSSMTLDRDINTAEAFASGTTCTSSDYYGLAGTTRKFFSHECAYLDLVPIVYDYYRGMEVNTMNVTIPTSGEVTAEFGMVGVDFDTTNTIFPLGGGSRTDSADVIAFAGSVQGASFIRDGYTTVDVESMSFNISNGREAKYGVGQETAAFVDQGDFNAEITAQLYFTGLDIKQKYLAGVRMALSVTLKDQKDGHKLLVEFPNVVITAAPRGKSGQSVTENVSFFAEESTTYGTKALIWFQPA